jgi:hypothetical protein
MHTLIDFFFLTYVLYTRIRAKLLHHESSEFEQ